MLRLRLFAGLGLWRIRRGLGIGIGPVVVTNQRRPRRRPTGGPVSIPGVVFAIVAVGSLVVCGLAGGR